jgi:translation initiation factor 3 subunit H
MRSLASHRLIFSSILQEIPLKIRTNALLSSFISTLSQPADVASSDSVPSLEPAALPSSYQALPLDPTALSQPLAKLIDALDAYKTEENNLAYLSRQIAREKTKADALLQKRKEENTTRVAQGLQPLPEADIQRLVKIPPEPSRLESMLLIGQVDAYAKTLEGRASAGLVKMYGTQANTSA